MVVGEPQLVTNFDGKMTKKTQNLKVGYAQKKKICQVW
jgi:hypothetical protein